MAFAHFIKKSIKDFFFLNRRYYDLPSVRMEEEKNKREKAADKSASILSKQYFCQGQCIV